MHLSDLTFVEVGRYLKKKNFIILPFGSTEEHSYALPLGTDTFIAQAIAEDIAKHKHWLVAPVVSVGFSGLPQPFLNFSGTISYQKRTLSFMISDYISSLYRHGFRSFFIINSHGGNNTLIKKTIPRIAKKFPGSKFYLHNWWKVDELLKLIKKLEPNSMGHAGGIEAALSLYLFYGKVQPNKFTSEYSGIKTKTGIINSNQKIATINLGKSAFKAILRGTLKGGLKKFECL